VKVSGRDRPAAVEVVAAARHVHVDVGELRAEAGLAERLREVAYLQGGT